jgi:hypothetical protein
MQWGGLKTYYKGVGWKTLRPTEIDPSVSNYHEFQGKGVLRDILGPLGVLFPARIMYLANGDEPEAIVSDTTLHWYESRKNLKLKPGDKPRSSEPRLYYPENAEAVVYKSRPGDLLVVAVKEDNSLDAFLIAKDSEWESRAKWLFGIPQDEEPSERRFKSKQIKEEHGSEFFSRQTLSFLGFTPTTVASGVQVLADEITTKFRGTFPSTKYVSEFIRSKTEGVDITTDPDTAIERWLDLEEKVFFALERMIVGDDLRNTLNSGKRSFSKGGKLPIDEILAIAQSVFQRRKSRVGNAFENHFQQLLINRSIFHVRGGTTEGKSKPDFLFPGLSEYKTAPLVGAPNLTILGLKHTCKDRWRQVLSEGAKVSKKHILTMERSISTHQTDEMKAHGVCLVVPKGILGTFTKRQQADIITICDFLDLTEKRQFGLVDRPIPEIPPRKEKPKKSKRAKSAKK